MTRSTSDLRESLRAVDTAMTALRLAGAPIPESLATERYELSRELSAALSETLVERDAPDMTTPRQVFVIMPFREPFDAYYREVIRPAVESIGYEIARSDEIYSSGAFVQTIWTQIL